MRTNVSGYIVSQLVKNGTICDGERECYEYCVNATLEIGFFAVAITLLGLVLGKLPQTALFLISTFSIKSFVGGYHASTATRCFVLSEGSLLASMYASDWLQGFLDTRWNAITFGTLALLAYLLAPVDCGNKRLEDGERYAMKRKCGIMLLVHALCFTVLFTTSREGLCYVYTTSLAVTILSMLAGVFMNRLPTTTVRG